MTEAAFNPETPPELAISRWYNTPKPITLAGLKGKVVLVTAFQMLCPGCLEHGLPQARKLAERFSDSDVVVLGLHSVFEHHDVMTPEATAAFMHEYQWPFPVGYDQPTGKGMPRTMAAYQMRGTPTLLVFDRKGRLRRHYFGRPDDMMLAAEIMALAIEGADASREESVAIERRIAATLRQPGHDHDHDHDHGHHHEHGDACGCGHDHHHEHDHAHGHHHGAGSAHAHDHGHDHAHDSKPGRGDKR